MLERRVEVDVVRYRERHVNLGVLQRHEVHAGVDKLMYAHHRVLPGGSPDREERIQARQFEDAAEPLRRQIEDAVTDAEPDAWTVTADREDAEAHRAVHADRGCLHARVSMPE